MGIAAEAACGTNEAAREAQEAQLLPWPSRQDPGALMNNTTDHFSYGSAGALMDVIDLLGGYANMPYDAVPEADQPVIALERC
jgi:hypothetical protein